MAAILPAILALGQAGYGLYQQQQGKKLMKEAEANRPEYEIPDSIKRAMLSSELESMRGLPEEVKSQMNLQMDRSRMASLSQINERRGGLGAISQLEQQQQDAIRQQALMDVQQREKNLTNMQNMRMKMAEQEQARWQWDEGQKYEEQLAKGQAMSGAGMQNIFGGVTSMATMAADGGLGDLGLGGEDSNIFTGKARQAYNTGIADKSITSGMSFKDWKTTQRAAGTLPGRDLGYKTGQFIQNKVKPFLSNIQNIQGTTGLNNAELTTIDLGNQTTSGGTNIQNASLTTDYIAPTTNIQGSLQGGAGMGPNDNAIVTPASPPGVPEGKTMNPMFTQEGQNIINQEGAIWNPSSTTLPQEGNIHAISGATFTNGAWTNQTETLGTGMEGINPINILNEQIRSGEKTEYLFDDFKKAYIEEYKRQNPEADESSIPSDGVIRDAYNANLETIYDDNTIDSPQTDATPVGGTSNQQDESTLKREIKEPVLIGPKNQPQDPENIYGLTTPEGEITGVGSTSVVPDVDTSIDTEGDVTEPITSNELQTSPQPGDEGFIGPLKESTGPSIISNQGTTIPLTNEGQIDYDALEIEEDDIPDAPLFYHANGTPWNNNLDTFKEVGKLGGVMDGKHVLFDKDGNRILPNKDGLPMSPEDSQLRFDFMELPAAEQQKIKVDYEGDMDRYFNEIKEKQQKEKDESRRETYKQEMHAIANYGKPVAFLQPHEVQTTLLGVNANSNLGVAMKNNFDSYSKLMFGDTPESNLFAGNQFPLQNKYS